eukprot:scaffold45444_cov168-Amphora_coffeaeformis.AAC.3
MSGRMLFAMPLKMNDCGIAYSRGNKASKVVERLRGASEGAVWRLYDGNVAHTLVLCYKWRSENLLNDRFFIEPFFVALERAAEAYNTIVLCHLRLSRSLNSFHREISACSPVPELAYQNIVGQPCD